MKIVAWQNSINSHQFYLWESVSASLGDNFTVILNKVKDHKTKKIKPEDIKNIDNIIYIGKFKLISALFLLSKHSDAVHVFLGFRNPWFFFPLMLFAIACNIKVAVMNEAFSTRPVGYDREETSWLMNVKVGTRPYLYKLISKLLYGVSTRIQPCILPLSEMAYDQFVQNGFSPDSMYPFGYFVPRQLVNENKPARKLRKFNIVFVGLLLERKGLDIVAQAVEVLYKRGYDIKLDVYGMGTPETFISPTSSCIRYKGLLLPQDVQSEIKQHDLLILPSRHDGWGVVVNEALLQGVPVIVSNQVGSKCLIEANGAGIVFKSENVNDLICRLEELFLQPARFDEMMRKAVIMGERILPPAGANYLLRIFRYHFFQEGLRPSAVWRQDRIL